MAATSDLWGDFSAVAVRTPVSILKEQASLLGKKTNNLLEAQVSSSAQAGDFYHSFSLIVPSLDYEYLLFQVKHGIDFYPVKELVTGKRLDDEEAFVEWLHGQLSAPKTSTIVKNLLAQVTS